MEDTSTPFSELIAKGLPLNPILSALIANPAVVDASRRAVGELIPVVERSLKGVRAGKLVGAASPSLLASCFAAGVAVGWLTAPAKGSETRTLAKTRLREWTRTATERAQAGKAYLGRRLSRRRRDDEPADSAPTSASDDGGAAKSGPEPLAHH